jgi:hypothetical protein
MNLLAAVKIGDSVQQGLDNFFARRAPRPIR